MNSGGSVEGEPKSFPKAATTHPVKFSPASCLTVDRTHIQRGTHELTPEIDSASIWLSFDSGRLLEGLGDSDAGAHQIVAMLGDCLFCISGKFEFAFIN